MMTLASALHLLANPDAFVRFTHAIGRRELVDADNNVWRLDGRTYQALLKRPHSSTEFGTYTGRDLVIVIRLKL